MGVNNDHTTEAVWRSGARAEYYREIVTCCITDHTWSLSTKDADWETWVVTYYCEAGGQTEVAAGRRLKGETEARRCRRQAERKCQFNSRGSHQSWPVLQCLL